MQWITDPTIWASLATLTALEIVLGIDNVIFVSIVSNKLPEHQRATARRIGLALALVLRVVFLLMISWIIGLTAPIFTMADFALSWRDLILLAGGLFLMAKGTHEIHASVEGDGGSSGSLAQAAFGVVVLQIVALDLVFSIDSVITAVGMVDDVGVMIAAVVISMVVMVIAAEPISRFVQEHPTVKLLALTSLLLVGVALIADGLHFHIPRGYLYFAVFFSALVEALNLFARRNRKKA